MTTVGHMTGLASPAVLDACRYFDTWLEFRRRHERVPGVQAAVLFGDDVILSTAHGVADVESGAALTQGHLFRIASHSKTFTATAILQLVERGAVRLDDTVGQWITALADTAIASVTLRELLSHAGGVVRDGHDGNFWQLHRPFPDVDGLLDMARDDAAILQRNERFKYSNVGYSLLGLVIEAASGGSYADWIEQHIVAPLGLADTGPEYDPDRAADYAAGHSSLAYGDERLVIEHVDTHAMAAATGFYSTASDVVRYGAAHFLGDDRLVSDDSKRMMQRVEWEVEGTGGSSYGLGFAVSTIGSRRVIGHGGGYPGHITRTFVDPVARLAVSVLTNAIDGPALGMATAAIRLIDLAAGAPAGGGADLSRFEGRFATLWGVFDVVALGGRLFQISPTEPDPAVAPTRLEVVDESTLRIAETNGYGSMGERLVYDRADDGTIRAVRSGSGILAAPLDRYRAAAGRTRRVTSAHPLRG